MLDSYFVHPNRTLRTLLVALTCVALVKPPPAGADLPLAWVQQYIQLDTSNPPGKELIAVDYLRRILHAEGIPTRLFVSPAGRPNLYARLPADDESAGPLVLVHHMDVVPPGPGWNDEPFSGAIVDGRIEGRGAVDVKSLGIAHLDAFLDLRRSGAKRKRDVVFLAVADEEAGGGQGVSWLLSQHGELFPEGTEILNEGGGNRVVNGHLLWWGVEVAQKRPFWLRISAHGRGGHGSMFNPGSAPHRLARALARLADRPLDLRVSPPVRRYLESVVEYQGPVFQQMVADLDEIVSGPDAGHRLLPGIPNYLLDTVQINVLQAGSRVNVTPEEAHALVDVRLLPDTDANAFLAEIRELLEGDAQVEVLLQSPPAEPSPENSATFGCLTRALSARAPVIPAFIPGVTDSRHFREREIPAYGFSPFALGGEDMAGVHGPNERISTQGFLEGVETMRKVLHACVAE